MKLAYEMWLKTGFISVFFIIRVRFKFGTFFLSRLLDLNRYDFFVDSLVLGFPSKFSRLLVGISFVGIIFFNFSAQRRRRVVFELVELVSLKISEITVELL